MMNITLEVSLPNLPLIGPNLRRKTWRDPKNPTKKFTNSTINIDDVFLSGRAHKQKDEVRKMALAKRKQYGQMIQKQVLKMHKKKTQDENPEVITRYSQGSKNEKVSMQKENPFVVIYLS
jgi:hypothetical protein